MKKNVTLVLPFLFLAASAFAQSTGNSDYYNDAQPASGNASRSFGNSATNYLNFNNTPNPAYNSPNRGPASAAQITNPNVVNIAVNGLMNIVADDYLAVFNIVQVGVDITETDDLLTNRIQLFRHKLQNFGIDSTDVKVDMISFVPRYAIEVENKLFSKTNNEVPAGFELQKNVLVHFKNAAKIDNIVTAAAQAEIYDLVKVDYYVPNIEKAYDTLMNACVSEVKERFKQYENLGFELDTVRKAVTDNFATVFPSQRYYGYQAFTHPSLPTTRKGGSPARLNEAEKTVSRYYNAVEVDRYDVVINPVIIEPVVQLSYTINVQYYLNDPKPQVPPKNNYFIITENGDAKQVFLGK